MMSKIFQCHDGECFEYKKLSQQVSNLRPQRRTDDGSFRAIGTCRGDHLATGPCIMEARPSLRLKPSREIKDVAIRVVLLSNPQSLGSSGATDVTVLWMI